MVHRQIGEQQGEVGIHNLVWESEAQRAFFTRRANEEFDPGGGLEWGGGEDWEFEVTR